MRIVTLLVIALFSTLNIYGQFGDSSTLLGQVMDPQGLAIPNALITVVSTSTSNERQTTTNEIGEFTLILQPDTYNVVIEASGFTKLIKTVKVTANERVRLEATLKIGEIGLIVTINDPFQSTSTTITPISTGFSINGASGIEARAFSGLTTIQVDNFRPSALNDIRNLSDQHNQLSNGDQVVVSYNGFRINPTQLGGSQMSVPVESIQTEIIGFNPFSIDTDNVRSSLINITSNTGGNRFNGSAFLKFRNNNLQARVPFGASKNNPSFDQEYFGGSLSGPIKKDTLFFYFAIEQQRTRGVTSVGFRDTLKHQIVPDLASTKRDNTLISATLNLVNNDDNFTGRYSFDWRDGITPGFSFGGKLQTPDNFQSQKFQAQQFTFTWSRLIGNYLVNELGFGSHYARRKDTPMTIQPQIVYPSLNSGGNFLADQRNTFITINLFDNFTANLGNHLLKSGFNYNNSGVKRPTNFNLFGNGIIFLTCDFPGELGCPGITSEAEIPVRLALINQETLTGGFIGFGKRGFIPSISNNAFSTYAQDNYRVNSNLNLFFGLRWDYDSDPSGINQVNQFRPTRRKHQRNTISSRIGIAWILKRIRIRGGHGFYHNQTALANRQLELLANGMRLPIIRATDTTFSNPFASTQGSLSSQIFVTSNNFKTPFISMFHLDGEIDLGQSMSLTTGFTSQRGRRFPRRFEVNIRKDETRIDNSFGSVIETQSVAHFDYDGFITSFSKRNYRRVGAIYASYTLARAIDDANEPLGVINTASDPMNPEIDRGAAPYVPRHNFNLDWIVALPFKFTLSTNVRAFSSLPFDIVQNHDFSGAIHSGFYRLPGLPRNAGNRQIKTGADLNRYIDAFNANSALVQERGGTLNRVDPNIKFSNPIFNVNLAVSKIIWSKDDATKRLQIKLDVFNLFNRRNIIGLSNVNLSGLENNLEKPNFGKPLGVLPGGVFGNFSSRAFQISARFTF